MNLQVTLTGSIFEASYPTNPTSFNYAHDCDHSRIRGRDWSRVGTLDTLHCLRGWMGTTLSRAPIFNPFFMSYPSTQDEQILAVLNPEQQDHYNKLLADSASLENLLVELCD